MEDEVQQRRGKEARVWDGAEGNAKSKQSLDFSKKEEGKSSITKYESASKLDLDAEFGADDIDGG